ncbi:MAG: hypothetical protein WDK96_00590 [Candidatus Paceibacterota bacterium]
MQLQQTRSIMQKLRERARIIRPNNLRINDWVDEYINECILNGKPVEILVQCCTALGLEKRKQQQGGKFIPLKAEIKLIKEEIPSAIDLFLSNNVEVSIFFTFNRSYVTQRRLSNETFEEYMTMIKNIDMDKQTSSRIVFLDWEEDVLGELPKPNINVLTNFDQIVSKEAISIELNNFIQILSRYPDKQVSIDELRNEAKFRISCEAEEGRFLTSKESPFSNGEFILIPFELPERYVFFKILAPDFQKRIVPILKPYPWRMNIE